LKHCFDSDEKNFERDLKILCETNDVRVAFDCIGGEETGKLMRILGREGVVVNYGCLSGNQIAGVESEDLIFRKKILRGFLMVNWLAGLAESEKVKKYDFIREHLEFFCTKVRETIPMKDFKKGYEKYQKEMDKGKMVVIMSDLAGKGLRSEENK